MNTKSVLIFFALFVGVLAVSSAKADDGVPANQTYTTPAVENQSSQPKLLEMWGTCYFYFNCEGNPVGLGKTASECRAQGGHSLNVPNHGCYNI